MTELTLFTAPKPFTQPHINIIQRNALQNWLSLSHGDNLLSDSINDSDGNHLSVNDGDIAVLIMGREEGMSEVADELNIRYVHEVECHEAGPPIISSMMDYARNLTDSPYMCISNADILYFPELLKVTRQAASLSDKFLLLGRRWDLDLATEFDFSPGWDKRLWSEIQNRGKLHAPLGSDYFIYPRDLLTDIPDFTIGRSGWDNWIIYHAMQEGWTVLDASPSLRIVHQNHDYSHLPGNRPPYKLPETKQNITLAGGEENMLTIMDMDYQLVAGEIRPSPLTLLRLVRRLEVSLTPKDSRKKGIRWSLTRQVRKLRRKLSGDA